MYYAYVLKSQKHGRYYIGSTDNIDERMIRHNSGRNKSTRAGMPWELKYKEEFSTREEAYRRELQIKSYKGGRAFKKLIEK